MDHSPEDVVGSGELEQGAQDVSAVSGAGQSSIPPAPASRRKGDFSSESIRVLKPRRAAPADAVRPTRADINLAALRHNLRVVSRHAGTARVWPVLKADGYGHGAPAVARTLERAGAHGFCVALLEEAVELREAGIGAPLLVMGGYYGGAFDEIVARRIVPVVYDGGHVEGLARAARAQDETVDVHLKIDTGMARLGVRPDGLAAFVEVLRQNPEIRVVGLMTHLASADAEDLAYTTEQLRRFDVASEELVRRGMSGLVRHAANSAALLRGQGLYDAVRPGLAVFGVAPRSVGGPPAPFSSELRPTMRVRTEIIDLRRVEEGEAVGYGGLFRARRPTRIATVPMGYADGLSRQLSNRGHMLVRGRRAPIVGAISMDMSMIDVTDVPGASIRDEVVVLGGQEGTLGKDAVLADELAEQVGSIPWEILTAISRRVPRFYREPLIAEP